MEALVCAGLHLAAISNISVLAAVYLLIGLVQTVYLVLRPHAPKWLYVILCIYAVGCLAGKLVFTGLYFSNTDFLDAKDRELLGFQVTSTQAYAYELFLTLFPDVLGVTLALLALQFSKSPKPTFFGKPWLWLILTFFAICVKAVFSCALLNLCYYLLALIWGAISTRRVPQHAYKWLCLSAVGLAVLHVDFSLVFDLGLEQDLWANARRELGALWFNRWHIGEVALVLVTLYFSLSACRVLLLAPRQDLLRPLNPFELINPRQTHLSSRRSEEGTELRESSAASLLDEPSRQRKSLLKRAWNTLNSSQTLFLSFKLLLAFWITHYCSWVGVLELMWLCYSILETMRYRAIASLGLMFLPVLLCQSIATFVVNILQAEVSTSSGVFLFSEFSWAEFSFQLLTLHVGFASILISSIEERTLFRGAISTQPCVSLILENADKVSLCAVFAIGLSAINLLHAGLMVICMVFILNTQLAKRRWSVLICYTMFLIVLRYIWILITRAHPGLKEHSILDLFGLPRTTVEMRYLVLPDDYLVWVLLAAGSMQLSAYRSLGQRGRAASTGSCFHYVLKASLWLYELLQDHYIWPVYVLLFLIMLISELNPLNAVRFLILLMLLVLHLKGKRKPISAGFATVKRLWFIFVYYSGGLMSFRYMYQFSQYSKDYDGSNSEYWMGKLGIQMYDSQQLYAAMVGDTIILLTAVMTARSFRSQEKMDRVTGQNTANGLLIDYIRQETHTHIKFSPLMRYLAGPFDKLLVFAIALLAIYWKLAVSTCVLLLLCLYGFYRQVSHYHSAASQIENMRRKTVDTRYKLWELLFVSTILCAALDYCAFAVPTAWRYQWSTAVAGFSSDGEVKIAEFWGYSVILILLAIEKHCMEFLRQQSESHQASLSHYWVSARVVAEEAIVLCLLLLAFTKLTVVSFIYLALCILFVCSRRKQQSMRLIAGVLAVVMALQYLVLLSNIHNKSAPQNMPSTHPKYIPWATYLNLTSAEVQFLNLGPDLTQLHGLSADLLVILLTWVYFQYLSAVHTSEDKVQIASLETAKSFVYNSAHIIILVLVLVFVSQSSGLTAIVYCVFCLMFLYKANELLRSEKGWTGYIRILRRYFTYFMLLDFTANVIYQVPLSVLNEHYVKDWGEALGLVHLWKGAGSETPEDAHKQYIWIVYKIITFALVQLIIRMFEQNDFKEFMREFRKKAHEKAEEVSSAMTRRFNDRRIEEAERYRQGKRDLDAKLMKLDEQVKSWHEKQERVLEEEDASINSDSQEVPAKVSLRRKLWLWVVSLANPFLFQEVVERARQPSNLTFTLGCWLAFAVVSSNTHLICYFCFMLNGLVYASLEALVFPLSMFVYALLEAPRPLPAYWRVMLAYAETVFFLKFLLNLNIWELANSPLDSYSDTYKIGFLKPDQSYTPSIFAYTVFDILCMFAILAHEYYLLRCGLGHSTEFQLENLTQAKSRQQRAGEVPFESDDGEVPVTKKSCWRGFIAFLTRVSPKVKEEKPGLDLYTPALLVQLLLLLYILFFYTQMDGESQVFADAFASSQFSGKMVVALLLQTGLMLLDRYLYLCATSHSTRKTEESVPRRANSLSWKSYFASKCVLYWVLVLFIHAMAFWYYPLSGNRLRRTNSYDCTSLHSNECNNFQVNSALQWFYILYLIYFLLTAAQIRIGMPSYRAGSMPLTRIDNDAARYTFQAYMGLPFFFELRTMVDWSFTKTSLDLFQWFKFEEIYSQLYISKVLLRGYYSRPRGEPIGLCEKFWMGVCGLLLVLLLILGPLIIFSSLNPIVVDNPVKSASVEIGALINQSYYMLFSAGRVQSITSLSADSHVFNTTSDVTETERENAQTISMPNSSDSLWTVPSDTKAEIIQGLHSANQTNSTTTVELSMSYTFTREYPPTQTLAKHSASQSLNSSMCGAILNVFLKPPPQYFVFPDFYSEVIRIPTAGTQLDPSSASGSRRGLLNLAFQPDVGGQFNYWTAHGISFYTISEPYSPITFNFSVLTFYVSVVYVVGRLMRLLLAGSAINLILTDIPHPEPLQDLCQGVYIARMGGDLKKEERLYFELIDILRSPEVLKIVTGRSALKDE